MQGNPIFMEKAIALATENVTSGEAISSFDAWRIYAGRIDY